MKVVNGVGTALRSWGHCRPIDPDALMAAAAKETGLNTWGDTTFREPLEILISAFESEARLTPFGRMVLRHQLRQTLCNRLWIEEAKSKLDDAPSCAVTRPLFVVGLPRTGTTLLFNLLAQDQSRRPLLTHETLFPVGTKVFGRRTDGRGHARLAARLADSFAPGLRTVHPFQPDVPEECTWLLANSLVSPYFMLMGRIPSYDRWLRHQSGDALSEAYRYYRFQLELLQRRSADDQRHWVLKSPAHLFALDSLLEVFPDACIVQTHRAPQDVVPSACSLFAVMRAVYSDDVDAKTIGPEVLDLLAAMNQRAVRVQESDHRVLHVDYSDLVGAPFDVIEKIYSHFNLQDSGEAMTRMQSWLEANPRHKHGQHKYTLNQFGLSEEDIVREFRTEPRQEGRLTVS